MPASQQPDTRAMVAEDDGYNPGELHRNVRELLNVEQWFGVRTLPRIGKAGSESIRPGSAAPVPMKPEPKAEKAEADQAPPSLLPDPLAGMPSGDAAESLTFVAERIANCERCSLCKNRTKTVPGEGKLQPEILFIGEGPGADEDRQGRPFVGAAGKLLDKMIGAMGFAREEVYIANIVKCRPPGNRTPDADEMAACLPYLEAQIEILKPKVICTLGNTPLRALTGRHDIGITRHRGKQFTWRDIPVIPTFHPSYLLRNAAGKKPCWEDLKQVLAVIGREAPG